MTGAALLGCFVRVEPVQGIAHGIVACGAQVALALHQQRRVIAGVRIVTGEAVSLRRRRMQRAAVHVLWLVMADEAQIRALIRRGKDDGSTGSGAADGSA